MTVPTEDSNGAVVMEIKRESVDKKKGRNPGSPYLYGPTERERERERTFVCNGNAGTRERAHEPSGNKG